MSFWRHGAARWSRPPRPGTPLGAWLAALLGGVPLAGGGCAPSAAGDTSAALPPTDPAPKAAPEAGGSTAATPASPTPAGSSSSTPPSTERDASAAATPSTGDAALAEADSTDVDAATSSIASDAQRGTSLGGDGAAGGCPGLFCEDFETGMLDPSIWNVQTSGGQTVVVETSVVAHGKYAAQFHANPNIESYDFIITKNAPAALNGHHFGRAYFNVTPKPPAEHTEFLFAGTVGFPMLKYLEVAGVGTAWQLTYVDRIVDGESYASGGTIPDAQWFCLEWEFSDTPDQAAVYVNGAESYSRSTITYEEQSTGLVGGFSDFGFGYYAWHPATYAFDIYYDDIVLDTQRVGCLE
jgi:hypothetical protein